MFTCFNAIIGAVQLGRPSPRPDRVDQARLRVRTDSVSLETSCVTETMTAQTSRTRQTAVSDLIFLITLHLDNVSLCLDVSLIIMILYEL